MMRRIGLIGFGAIGSILADVLRNNDESGVRLVGIMTRALPARGYDPWSQIRVVQLEALLESKPDLIVECAGHAALASNAPNILGAGIDLLASSVGVLADPGIFADVTAAAMRGRAHLVIPSGAIGGLDWLAAAKLAGLSKVIYRARKSKSTWIAAGAVEAEHVDVSVGPQVFYRENVRTAARRFPKNTNVAAAVALVTLGFDHTSVELMASDETGENYHEVEAVSTVGSLTLQIRGRADPKNPNTSLITGYSLARSILNQSNTIRI